MLRNKVVSIPYKIRSQEEEAPEMIDVKSLGDAYVRMMLVSAKD